MKWPPILAAVPLSRLWQAAFIAQFGGTTEGLHITHPKQPNTIQECRSDIENAPNWAVKNVTRKLPTANEAWMGFHITSEGYTSAWCYILVHVKGAVKSASFSDVPCAASNFSVSWGFCQENEAGIMTLVNRASSRLSWFGWNHINDSEFLADVGPNATHDVNTKGPTPGGRQE